MECPKRACDCLTTVWWCGHALSCLWGGCCEVRSGRYTHYSVVTTCVPGSVVMHPPLLPSEIPRIRKVVYWVPLTDTGKKPSQPTPTPTS